MRRIAAALKLYRPPNFGIELGADEDAGMYPEVELYVAQPEFPDQAF
jgi:hypothetical protein